MNVGALSAGGAGRGMCELAQRLPEQLFDPNAFGHIGVQAVLEDLEPVPASSFGQVHGGVGILQHLFCGDRPRGLAGSEGGIGDADAGADDVVHALDRDRLLQGRRHSLGHLHREQPVGRELLLGTVPVRGRIEAVPRFHDDDELVAADAGDGVMFADHLVEPLGDLEQQCVAGGVTGDVVDPLEAVQVAEQHRNLASVARRSARGPPRAGL